MRASRSAMHDARFPPRVASAPLGGRACLRGTRTLPGPCPLVRTDTCCVRSNHEVAKRVSPERTARLPVCAVLPGRDDGGVRGPLHRRRLLQEPGGGTIPIATPSVQAGAAGIPL